MNSVRHKGIGCSVHKNLSLACTLNCCAVLFKCQWMDRFDKSVSSAARPAQALGAHNLACDNGTAGLAGESGGSIQSSATRCCHLKHLVQDCPDNCAHGQQFGTNLLRWMASLIIMLSRCSSNSLPKHTMATTRLARLYCKATGTGARSEPSTWVSCLADSYYLASGWFELQRQLGRSVPWIFTWVPACGAFPRRLVYFLKVEYWALFQNVLQ